jgi:hypothetical protein
MFYDNRRDSTTTEVDADGDNVVVKEAGHFTYDLNESLDLRAWVLGQDNNVVDLDPELGAPYSMLDPDFRPGATSPAADGRVAVSAPPTDGFFESVDFIGGVDPDNDWTAGWTTTEQPAGE